MLRSRAIPGLANQTVNYFGSVLKSAEITAHRMTPSAFDPLYAVRST